jgi:hypothetical protein
VSTDGAAPTDDAATDAMSLIGAWEALAVRMTAGWPPDGWYPAEYYREDLQNRDALAAVLERLPPDAAAPLAEATARIDEVFRAGTGEARGSPAPRGWWWGRVPDPIPWQGGSWL